MREYYVWPHETLGPPLSAGAFSLVTRLSLSEGPVRTALLSDPQRGSLLAETARSGRAASQSQMRARATLEPTPRHGASCARPRAPIGSPSLTRLLRRQPARPGANSPVNLAPSPQSASEVGHRPNMKAAGMTRCSGVDPDAVRTCILPECIANRLPRTDDVGDRRSLVSALSSDVGSMAETAPNPLPS
jgi:hypothetical protein